jgi:hypothetical protein
MSREKETVHGYEIKQSITFTNNRGFALAENPNAPQPFVTWQFTDENGKRDYYWGHYTTGRDKAERDLVQRVADHQTQYGVAAHSTFPEMELYSYFSTQQPIDIGTFPKIGREPLAIVSFNKRMPVEDGAFRAWGILTYSEPLTEKQIDDYELRAAQSNPDRQRPSIVAQLAEGTERAAGQEPSDKKQPLKNRGDR